ncbi:MAG: DUF5011 domain-containing protein [Bacteroidota bacterium]
MKNIRFLFFSILAFMAVSCEYFESPDDTATVSQGFITYPALSINGEQFITISVGGTFEDEGAVATLGTNDITNEIVIDGTVDPSTPGVYIIDYSVSITNDLDEVSSVSEQRYVAVVSEAASALDLSGTYSGDGTAISGAWNQDATVTSISGGWYRINKALASGNNLSIFFALVGGNNAEVPMMIVVPNQNSPFGTVNSTSPGTSAELTENGFQWNIFISCCGIFGPIIFTK